MTVPADYVPITAQSVNASIVIPIPWDFGADASRLFITQQNLITGDTRNSKEGGFTWTVQQDPQQVTIEQYLPFAGNNTEYRVERETPPEQDYNLNEQSVLSSQALEQTLDDIVRMIQENRGNLGNVITSPNPFVITNKVERAGTLILFDSTTGEPTYITPSELPGTGTFDYVVDKNGTGTHTTIQGAVSAGQVRGLPYTVLILNGEYTEDVLISTTGASLFGASSWNGGITINGNITINATGETSASFSNLMVNGSFIISSGGNAFPYLDNIEVRSSGGAAAIQSSNTGGASTLVLTRCSFIEQDDLAPAFLRTAGQMNINSYDCEFSRNGSSGSSNSSLDYSAGGGGIALLRNAQVNGQITLTGGTSCAVTLSGSSSQIVTTGTTPCVDMTGYNGFSFFFGINMAVLGGGNVVTPAQPGRFFYAGVIAGFGTNVGNSLGTRIPVDGISLLNNGPGTNFLADDGTYKATAGSGDMTKAVYDPANISEQLVGVTAVQSLLNKVINGVTLDDSGPGTNYLADDGTYKPITIPPPATTDYILLENIKPRGDGGGDIPGANIFNNIDLNTETYDSGGHCTLNAANGRFTLAAGNYRLKASIPLYSVEGAQTRLVINPGLGTEAEIKRGTSVETNIPPSTVPISGISFINAEFTSTGEEFQIQVASSLSPPPLSTFRQGRPADLSPTISTVEVYAQVEIWKEA